MHINVRPTEEGGTGIPTGEEILRAYAIARGFSTQGLGQPDESRAARYILKDYVKGKLLFCHPPPSNPPIDPKHFNRELYDADHLPQKRRAALAAQSAATVDESEHPSLTDHPDMTPLIPIQGPKSQHLDKKFFGPGSGQGTLNMPFHHKYSEQGQQQAEGGKQLSGRKARTMLALDRDLEPDEAAKVMGSGKKHFKGNKRALKKVRSEYD